ncbi:MAG TPA: DUF6531 domain-containing protein, partial [bacterium]|nr:DUF6531 domain-containing protein [bacterium]
MSGSKRLCLFSLVIFFNIFTNLLFIGNCRAASPTPFFINGPSQMSINQTATLTVSGGCGGPYHWSISGGGYLSSTVGDSVNYTSPQSNPNCNNNSIISVTDQAGQIVYKRIAVNSGDITTIAYEKKIGCFNHGEYHCAYGNYHCCMFDLYNCTGSLMGWLAYSSGGDCCGTNPSGATCDFQSLCSSAPDLLDKRTSTDISNGCCPEATLPPPPAPVTVSSCTVCDLQVSDFTALPTTFTAGQGSTTFAGSIFSSSSFSWTLMIAGKTFSGTDNSFSVTWDGTNSVGQLVHAGTYTATLTVTSDDDPSCSMTKSIDIYVNVNCDLQINDFNASPQTFTPGSGSTIFTGNINSSSPFNWILNIAGKNFNGYGSPASAEWDGSNLAGNFVEPGTYTATLSATSQYDHSCVVTKTTDVSVVKNCDLLADFYLYNNTTGIYDRDGLVIFAGDITSSQSFTWELTINGKQIRTGSNSDVSVFWNLIYENFKKGESKKYTALLTVTPDDSSCPVVKKSVNFTVTSREKDCKLLIAIDSSLNILSGNLSHSQNLFTVPNSVLMSDFTLYYNSMEGYSGVLGTGWTHTYNVFLSTDPTDDAYILSDGRGGKISLYRNGNYYTSDISVYPMLQVNADGTFTLTYKNSTVYHFNTNGKLTAIT